MHRSVALAARDLDVLGRLAVVPGLVAAMFASLLAVFGALWLADAEARPLLPWAGPAAVAIVVAALALGCCSAGIRTGSTIVATVAVVVFGLGILGLLVWWGRAGELGVVAVLAGWTVAAGVLSWSSTRVRRVSPKTIGFSALASSIGIVLFVAWWSGDRQPAIVVVMTAVVPSLAASSWWGLQIGRRLQSRLPTYRITPHATRRLSIPRDARALRMVIPALLGCQQILLTLGTAMVLAPLLRHAALSVSSSWFLPGAYRQFRRVRAVISLRAQDVRLEDRRAPVLLLRSFADDDLATERTKVRLVNVTQTTRTLEELIVAQLWEVGPVIAIGEPGQDVDPIGAARERIVGPLWQPRVQALLDESALVVLVLGETEGLAWEYEQLSPRAVPVLAVLPPRDAAVLSQRWRRFAASYAPARSVALDEASELPLLVWFGRQGEPVVVSGDTSNERSYELAFAAWRADGEFET